MGIEGSINLGFILRLAVNFDVERIVLVKPRITDYGKAKVFAAKADYLLEKTVIVDSLEEALTKDELVVCTTAKKGADRDILRQTISAPQLPVHVRGWRNIALVFGRESTGLTREELSICDVLVNIPASPKYPVLNLSHAVAIILYLLFTDREKVIENLMGKEDLSQVVEVYARVASMLVKGDEKISRVVTAFKKILFKSSPTRSEGRNLLFLLRRIERRLRECFY